MKKLTTILLLLTVGFSLQADGLVGNKYYSFGYALSQFDDTTIDDAYGNFHNVNASINHPIHDNVDFTAGAGYTFADDVLESNAVGLNAGIRAHLNPDEAVNPFIRVGIDYVDVELTDAAGNEISDDNTSLALGLGVQIMANDDTYIIPEARYNDDSEVWQFAVTLGTWFDDSLGGSITPSFDEDENFTIAANINFAY